MKNSKTYLEERAETLEILTGIVDTAKSEERELTSDEVVKFDSLTDKADSLDTMAKRAVKMETLKASQAKKEVRTNTETPKELKNYSFQEAYRQAFTGKLEGLVKEMDQEARRENPNQAYRGLAIPSSVLESRDNVLTGGLNGTQVQSFTDQLIASSVLVSAGAEMYTGVNNAKFPIIQEISSAFIDEDGGTDATEAGSVASLTLEPNKLISVVNMSQEAMVQNAGIEAAIRRNLALSIMAQFEKNLLASADASAGPASILADAADGGATLSAAALLAAEGVLFDNNVNPATGKFAVLCNGSALGVIKGLVQATGVSSIYDNVDKTTMGYSTFVSSNVGNKATDYSNVLFGDMSKIKMAMFGGLDLLFDPYTLSRQGVGSLIATALVDGDAVQNGAAFVEIQTAS